MQRSDRRRSITPGGAFLEPLEPRQLLSSVFDHMHVFDGLTRHAAIQLAPKPAAPVSTGTGIFAQAQQPFRAVVGLLNPGSIPKGYTLRGTIDWGDGTPTSTATFVRRANGTL